MTETPLELAERALAHADGDAQVTVVAERSLLLRFARSRPTQATDVDDLTVTVLRVHEGHTGAARTNATGDDALRAAARSADDAARAAARDGARGEHPGLPAPAAPRGHEGFDPETARLEPATGGDALRAAFAVAADEGVEAFGAWTAGEVRTAIASTSGTRLQDAVTDAFLKVVLRDGDGRSGYGARTAVGVRALDAEATARRAAERLPRGPLGELEPGTYPVVLDVDAVGVLLSFLGVLAFDGRAHVEGRGALSDRLGSRVAAPAINLSDSPRHPRTLPRAFDSEGVPKAPLPLIQDGIAHRVCHDLRSGARAGVPSTGHAVEAGLWPGGPAPTNLVLGGGGERDVHELARPVERGVLITRLWYVNPVHEAETLLTGVTRDGTFLIEDGRIAGPVRDLRFTDSALGVLARTEALTAGPQLVSEGEFYGRRLAAGTVCPALRCSALRLTA